MSALRRWAATMDLLQDEVRPRCIFLTAAPHAFVNCKLGNAARSASKLRMRRHRPKYTSTTANNRASRGGIDGIIFAAAGLSQQELHSSRAGLSIVRLAAELNLHEFEIVKRRSKGRRTCQWRRKRSDRQYPRR